MRGKSLGSLIILLLIITPILYTTHTGVVTGSQHTAGAYAAGSMNSGVVVRLEASMLEELIGVEPGSILAAAYTDSGWVRLPIRIYDKVIHNNQTTVYVMPGKVGESTIIEVKLPPAATIHTSPEKEMPRFLTGGDGYIHVEINDARLGGAAHIYLFYDMQGRGHVYWSSAGYQHLYNIDHARIADPFETELAPIGQANTPGAAIVEATPHNTIVEARQGPLPGGEPPIYNLVEIRPQHTIQHLEADYLLDQQSSTVSTILQVLDPDAPAGVKWSRVRLTLMLTPMGDFRGAAPHMLEVMVVDTGEAGTFTLYPSMTNIIVFDIVPNPYGSSSEAIQLEVRLHGIRSPGEKWSMRLLPTVYLAWSGMLTDSPREGRYAISLIDDTEITMTLPRGSSTWERQIHLKNARPLAIVNGEPIDTAIRVSSQADPHAYPLEATIYLDSARLCSTTLHHPLEEGLCRAQLDPGTIASILSRGTPIPVTLVVETPAQADSQVKLYVDTVDPLEVKVRQMYYTVIEGHRILFTSTMDDYDIAWNLIGRLIMGGMQGAWAFSGEDLHQGVAEARVSWDPVYTVEGYQTGMLELNIDFQGAYPETVCSGSLGCYNIAPIQVDKAQVIVHASGASVYPLSVRVVVRGETETIWPEHPSGRVQTITGLLKTMLGSMIHLLRIVSWSLDTVSGYLESSIDVDIGEGYDTVDIVWDAGLFNEEQRLTIKIAMDLEIDSPQPECREQAATVRLYSGDRVFEGRTTWTLCPSGPGG